MAKHRYEVIADLADGRPPIIWETGHPQTAHRWYRELHATGRPVDGGAGKVVRASIFRDDTRLMSAAVRVGAA